MSDKDEFLRLYRAINESQSPSATFWSKDLPDIRPTMRSVHMPAENLAKFRASYATLLAFAALITGKPPSEVCALDLIAPLLNQMRALDAEAEQ